jgi:O-antigen ligase
MVGINVKLIKNIHINQIMKNRLNDNGIKAKNLDSEALFYNSDMIIVNKLLALLVILALLLLPFSEEMKPVVLKKIFGIFAYEGAFYPFLIATILYGYMLVFRKARGVLLPKEISFKFLVFFLIFIVVSGIFNINGILHNHGYGTSGAARFLETYLEVIFISVSVFIIYYVAKIKWKENTFNIIRKVLLFSFIIPGAYAFLQALYLFNFKSVLPFINVLYQPLHLFLTPKTLNVSYNGRINSVAAEPSIFGTYINFIFPWILSYFYTAKRNKWIIAALLAYIILINFLTYSRTGYFEIIAVILAYLLFAKYSNNKSVAGITNKIILTLIILFIFGAVFFGIMKRNKIINTYNSLSPSKIFNAKKNPSWRSDESRLVPQLMGFKIAVMHPIFGVGFGQFGYYFAEYLPKWAFKDAGLTVEMNPNKSIAVGFPPARGLLALIAAQTGLVGLFLWLSVWALMFRGVFKLYRKMGDADIYMSLFGIIILSDVVVCLLDWVSNDSFRFYSYWFTLGLGLYYIYYGKKLLAVKS